MFSNARAKIASLGALVAVLAVATTVFAAHSWGSYHWARTANPFTVKLGDNVATAWDAYLVEASGDWSQSDVLDTAVVTGGTTARRCRPTTGRVEVCDERYGSNGWLGVASIWVSGNHITKATVKLNDTYFNTPTYNTPPWRRFVMCQEVGHTFGLDHQDEDFSNPNLGTCMDYTSDPDGPLSNEHPNVHDHEQLEAIYTHLDAVTTVGQTVSHARGRSGSDADDEAENFGQALRRDSKGRRSLSVRDLGRGEQLFTFILWAE